MAEVLSGNNVEEEFVWSTVLDKDNKEFVWNPSANKDGTENPAEITRNDPEDEYDEELKPGHRLLIKNAFCSAEDGSINIVQLECLGYEKKEVKCPLLAMKPGTDFMKFVDQPIPGKAKLTLIKGDGPVTLVGSHVLDMGDYRDMGTGGDESEEEAEEVEDEEMETAASDDKENKNSKRKSLETVNGDGDNATKKAKLDAKSPKGEKSPAVKNGKSPKAAAKA